MSRLMIILVALLSLPATASAQSLEGVWRMVETEVQGGPNPAVYTGSQIQPSYVFYVGDHFTYLIDNARERRMPNPEATPQETVDLISPLAFAAGTFERNGSTIEYTRTTSINPAAYQPDVQPQVRAIEVLTADRLETSATNPETGAKVILKYVRVE